MTHGKSAAAILIALSFAFAPQTRAEAETFEHLVTQYFAGSQSPDDAKRAAVKKARLEVLDIAGGYVQSLSVVKNGYMEHDEIVEIAGAVLEAEVVYARPCKTTADGYCVEVFTKVTVDDSEVSQKIEELLKDRVQTQKKIGMQRRDKELVAKLDRLQKEYEKLERYCKEMEGQLDSKFRKVVEQMNATDWNAKAFALWNGKAYEDPDSALQYLKKAIELDSCYAEAFINMGIAWFQKGDYEMAETFYSKAVGLKPDNPDLYLNRGVFYKSNGNLKEALKDYNRAIEYGYKEIPEAFYNRGLVHYEMRLFAKAIQDFDEAILLDPNNPSAHFNRGLSCHQDGKTDQAIQSYCKTIDLDPTHVRAYKSRGKAYLRLGMERLACDDFRRASSLGVSHVLEKMKRQGKCLEQ